MRYIEIYNDYLVGYVMVHEKRDGLTNGLFTNINIDY